MLLRFLCLGILCSLIIFSPVASFAAEANGEMEARIIDPMAMDIDAARQLCAEEKYLVRCDIFRETLKEQNRDRRGGKKHKNIKSYKVSPLNEYDVFTASFE